MSRKMRAIYTIVSGDPLTECQISLAWFPCSQVDTSICHCLSKIYNCYPSVILVKSQKVSLRLKRYHMSFLLAHLPTCSRLASKNWIFLPQIVIIFHLENTRNVKNSGQTWPWQQMVLFTFLIDRHIFNR